MHVKAGDDWCPERAELGRLAPPSFSQAPGRLLLSFTPAGHSTNIPKHRVRNDGEERDSAVQSLFQGA